MASINSFAVPEWIRKLQGEENIDTLRELVRIFAQSLIYAEATQKIGAEHYERSYRKREWDTRLGTIELNIPKLRKG